MNWHERVPARVGFWAVLLLGIFAWAPALHPGYWQGWEGFTPVFQSITPTALASIGATPDLWRGTGSGAFLIVQPLLRLGAEPAAAVRFSFILVFLLGGSAVYVWLADRLGDLGAGLAGLGYMLLPIFLATVYVRGSLSDALIMALTPLALAGLASYSERRSMVGAAVAVLSILWIWRIQAGLAAVVTAMLVLYALIVERKGLVLLIVLAGGAAGVASLIPLWSVSSTPTIPFARQFVDLNNLFDAGRIVGSDLTASAGEHPFQLGFVFIAGAAFTVWGVILRRVQTPPLLRRLIWFSVAATLVACLLATSASTLFWEASHADRLLTYPWQVLLVVAPLQAVLIGMMPIVISELETPVYWSVLAAIIVLASLSHLAPAYTQTHVAMRPVAILGENQILILGAQLTEQESPRAATLEVTWQPLRPLDFDYNVFFQAVNPTDAAGAAGDVVAQIDVQPLGDAQPPTSWRPGQVLTNSYTLNLADAPSATPMIYYFGYYDWRDGKRLTVDAGRDDKLVLHGK